MSIMRVPCRKCCLPPPFDPKNPDTPHFDVHMIEATQQMYYCILEKIKEYQDVPTGKTYYHSGGLFGPTKTVETKSVPTTIWMRVARWWVYEGTCGKCNADFNELRHKFGDNINLDDGPWGEVRDYLKANGRYIEEEMRVPA